MSENRMLTATEVAKRLGVSRNTAYSVIRDLNVEMQLRGCKVLPGRVSERHFEYTFFGNETREETEDVR